MEYDYDAAGRPITETVLNDGTPLVTERSFDQRGLLIAETDPRGAVADEDPTAFTTELAHDELGRLVTITAPPVPVEKPGAPAETLRPVATTGYNAFGEVLAERDANGEVTGFSYDKLGREVGMQAPPYTPPGADEPIRVSTSTTYDALSNIVSITDGAGNTTTFDYDQRSRPIEMRQPPRVEGDEPGVWQYSYTRAGERLSTTDPTGARIEATYDGLGRQITQTELERYPTSAAYTTNLRYDDVGNLVELTTPTGETTSIDYDEFGQPIRSTDPAGVHTETGYDMVGRIIRQVDGAGRVTTVTYDQAGRPKAEASRDAANVPTREVTYTHDAAGNQTSVTDALGATSTFVYDALGRVIEQNEPVGDGESITTGLGYDAAGNPTRFTDGRGNATHTVYNSLGLVESVIEPATDAHPDAADRTWTTSYDTVGNPVRMVSPGGVTRDRVFDALGNLIRENGADAEAATTERVLDYDAAGRLVGAGSPQGLNTFGYNDRGSLVSAAGPGGTAQFGYDESGRPVSRIDAAGQASFAYTDGRLSEVQDGLTSQPQAFGYDEAGQLTSLDYGDGRIRELTYDEFGRATGDVLTDALGTEITAIEYGFDLADRLTSKTTSGTAGAGENTYAYDESGRLTSWTGPEGTTDYEWDASGNRVAVGDKVATYDERNRLLDDGDYRYSHSARGTLAERDSSGLVEEFSFDAFDRLIAQGGTSYSYDSLDRVVARNGAGGYAYAGMSQEPVGDGGTLFGRGPDDELLAWSDASTTALAISDRHGDVIGGLPVGGVALTGSRAYDPFGRVVETSGQTGIIGFQGDWTDPDTGMINMGARWYDPETGGFLSRDDIELPTSPSILTNRYVYGAGAPTNHFDPDGHWVWVIPIAGAIARGIAAGARATARGAARGGRVVAICARNSRCRDSAFSGITNALETLADRLGRAKSNARARNRQDNRFCWNYCPTGGQGSNPGSGGLPPGGVWSGPGGGSSSWTYYGPGAGGGGGWYVPPPPPPPDPAIKAREENRDDAINVPHVMPDGYDAPWFGDGPTAPVSTSPSLPAREVGDLFDSVKDIAESYDEFHRDLLDSTGSVITNISLHDSAPSEVSLTDPSSRVLDGESCDTSNSFAAGTEVLLADGSSKPIEDVEVGDEVLATDPTTGETSARPVTAVIVGGGVKHLVDITVSGSEDDGDRETLTATAGHPFWVPELDAWVDAEDLEPGHRFETGDHRDAEVAAVELRYGLQEVYNLTVDGLHTYYVLAGTTPVLVHNSNSNCGSPAGGKNGDDLGPKDFHGSEYSLDEMVQFVNGHTGDAHPTMGRPSASQIETALRQAGPRQLDGQNASRFDYDGVRVIINWDLPWKSTAYFPRK